MRLDEIVLKMKELTEALMLDATARVEKGNNAAGARARKASLELTKLLKDFRKASVISK